MQDSKQSELIDTHVAATLNKLSSNVMHAKGGNVMTEVYTARH